MKKLIFIYIISVFSINTIQCQFISNPILNTIDNRKEIKTYYGSDYLRNQEHFDRKGNLIFSKTYNEKGEVLSIQYNEYTDNGELSMRIMTSTISDLSLYYADYTEEGIVTEYYNSIWNRDWYDPRTKKFLQEVTTIENLLKHKQVRKLIKKRRKSKSEKEIYLDSKGRKIKKVYRGKKVATRIVEYDYDESNNLISTTYTNVKQKEQGKKKYINEFDASGNIIKTLKSKLIQKDDEGAKEWMITDSTQTKYNNQDQRIVQLSWGLNKKFKKELMKTVWEYDEENRLINLSRYNKKGEKEYEEKYEYKNKQTMHLHKINYEYLRNSPQYEPTIIIFEIEFYKE